MLDYGKSEHYASLATTAEINHERFAGEDLSESEAISGEFDLENQIQKEIDMSASLVLDKGITIVCDGGCKNNGSFVISQRHMYGSFAVFNNGVRLQSITMYGQQLDGMAFKWECDDELWAKTLIHISPTNNVAELEMFIMSLAYLKVLAQRSNPAQVAATPVRILTDSQFVIGQVVLNNKTKSGNTKQHVETARDMFANSPWQVTVEHVSGDWVKQVLGH